MFEGAQYDGVFGIWYGTGSGIDRCGDVFRHANAAGTSPLGGGLAIVGDDCGAKSFSLFNQTEHIFKAVMWLSWHPPVSRDIWIRHSRLCVAALHWGLGCYKRRCGHLESARVVDVDHRHINTVLPGFFMPPGSLNIRCPDPPLAQATRLKLASSTASSAALTCSSILTRLQLMKQLLDPLLVMSDG